MTEIFTARDESAYEIGRHGAPTSAWPMAGMKLDAGLRKQLGMPDSVNPDGIRLAGMDEEYAITPNGYLIPYYAPSREKMDRSNLAERNEELMIDRARSFINHAQPELGVLRTKEAIDHSINIFENMPEDSHQQIAAKAARFKVIAGSIVIRLEMLGRMIYQGNTEGVKTEYNALTGKPVHDGDDTYYLGKRSRNGQPIKLTPEQIERLNDEASRFYRFLTHPEVQPYLRNILLTDKKIDRDGLLIDLAVEMGKGLRINAGNEQFIRRNIVFKIGDAMESIDDLHDLMEGIMTKEPTADAFAKSIKNFIDDRGEDYDIRSVDDVVARLNEYAALCRARASIRSDDPAYDEIFQRKSLLTGLFNGENGLLQSMRRVGRTTGPEISEMRSLLRDGIKLMERTGYTRMGCNHSAPRIWVPQFDSPRPVDQFLIKQFLSPQERERSRAICEEAKKYPERAAEGEMSRTAFLNQRFCSLGRLEDQFEALKKEMQSHEKKPGDYRGKISSERSSPSLPRRP